MSSYEIDAGWAATHAEDTFLIRIDGEVHQSQAAGLAHWLLSWSGRNPIPEEADPCGAYTDLNAGSFLTCERKAEHDGPHRQQLGHVTLTWDTAP